MTEQEKQAVEELTRSFTRMETLYKVKCTEVEARKEEIERLKSENASLRERLEKTVELPVKIGDTVYFIPTYNGNPIWGVQKGVVQMVGITQRGYHVKIRDRADFNKTYMFGKSAFLLKEQAEALLAERKGGKG